MPLIIVTAFFVTSYLVSNLMAVKVIGLFDLFYFDAGTITFPFAYMLGDVLTEIWGYRTTRKIIQVTTEMNRQKTFSYTRAPFVTASRATFLPEEGYRKPRFRLQSANKPVSQEAGVTRPPLQLWGMFCNRILESDTSKKEFFYKPTNLFPIFLV